MFRKLAPLPLAALFAQGCVVHDSDHDDHAPPPPPPPNAAPYVADAGAGVYWDGYYHDDIWYFEAVVDDPNGPYDIVEVWADVYDEYHGVAYVETFELYPTNDPYVWFSDWMGYSTHLDPWYDGYTVDFVVYDAHGASGYTTVWAASY